MARKKDNKVYFGLFIIFLMVSSSIGFMYSGEDSSTKKINGYKFTKTQYGWETYIDEIKSNWVFNYLPNEVDFDPHVLDLNTQEIYIYSEKDEQFIDSFKYVLLYKGLIVKEMTELECNDNVWVLTNGENDPEITEKDGCIYLNGNINKLIDSLTYRVFGVI